MAALAVWGVSKKSGRQALAALMFLILVLGISACGGGDSGESDEEQVEAAIETALTSTDPSACGESRTIAFMEETGKSTGAKAERECEETVASREGLPDSVTISKIEVEDGEATAEVTFKGGDGDGLVMDVALVEDDGSWKIDDFTGLARLDRDRFTARIESQFKEDGLGPTEVRCLIGLMNELPQAEFEQLALGGDEEEITKLTDQCEAKIESDRVNAKAERQAEKEEEAELEAELDEELAEIEAEEPASYPRSVQQAFLATCLASSGSNFNVCECSLESLEANYTAKELEQAEANIASGRLREMIEQTAAACS